MALTLTPYVKKGLGTISTSGSSTTTGCDNVRGFRNVAVGATLTEDVPPRTSHIWISSIDWIIKRDKPNWVMVLIAMVECKNRGSL